MLSRTRLVSKATLKIYKAGPNSEARLRVAVKEMLAMGGVYVKFAQLLLMNQIFRTQSARA